MNKRNKRSVSGSERPPSLLPLLYPFLLFLFPLPPYPSPDAASSISLPPHSFFPRFTFPSLSTISNLPFPSLLLIYLLSLFPSLPFISFSFSLFPFLRDPILLSSPLPIFPLFFFILSSILSYLPFLPPPSLTFLLNFFSALMKSSVLTPIHPALYLNLPSTSPSQTRVFCTTLASMTVSRILSTLHLLRNLKNAIRAPVTISN